MSNVLQNALRIAVKAHEGQVDRAGKAYIYHPLAVAMKTSTFDEFVTALLHDVLEDSDYTAADLRAEGIPGHIVDALLLLTHEKGKPYMEYVAQLKGNPLARAVKIADLTHNSDMSRLAFITDKDLERAKKYRQALEYLSE